MSLLFPTGLAAAVFTAVEESQRDHHRQDADAEVEAEVEEEHHQARHLIMNRLTEAFKNMSSLTSLTSPYTKVQMEITEGNIFDGFPLSFIREISEILADIDYQYHNVL